MMNPTAVDLSPLNTISGQISVWVRWCHFHSIGGQHYETDRAKINSVKFPQAYPIQALSKVDITRGILYCF